MKMHALNLYPQYGWTKSLTIYINLHFRDVALKMKNKNKTDVLEEKTALFGF